MSYRQFQKTFRQLIAAPTLGEPRTYQRQLNDNEQGPASRELHKTKLLAPLKSDEFCRVMYQLSRKYGELEVERIKVPSICHRMLPAIQHYRNAAKYLRGCAQRLVECDKKYRNLIDFRSMQEINSAQDLLKTVADKLESQSRVFVSNVHPENRRKHHRPSEWDLPLKLSMYPLERLASKAPDQWFYANVNSVLHEFIKRKNLPRMTDTTRFKVIAAVCAAAINVNVTHSAIKEFFIHHSPRLT